MIAPSSSARCSGWQTSSKAIKANRRERSGPQRERRHSLWNGRQMRPPSRRKRRRIGHDRWRAARRLQISQRCPPSRGLAPTGKPPYNTRGPLRRSLSAIAVQGCELARGAFVKAYRRSSCRVSTGNYQDHIHAVVSPGKRRLESGGRLLGNHTNGVGSQTDKLWSQMESVGQLIRKWQNPYQSRGAVWPPRGPLGRER